MPILGIKTGHLESFIGKTKSEVVRDHQPFQGSQGFGGYNTVIWGRGNNNLVKQKGVYWLI